MPKSSNIYIVVRKQGGEIIGAWTDEREMVSWLRSRGRSLKTMRSIYDVIRVCDGVSYTAITIPWEEIPS